MLFNMGRLYFNLSLGLDAVENELLGSTRGHGKRIAVLTASMAKYLNLSTDEIVTMTAAALLHDNALTETYCKNKLSETISCGKTHCEIGERNIQYIPFPKDPSGIIKYHHERMDGSGPFKMNGADTPLGAQLIAIADSLDVELSLHSKKEEDLKDIRTVIKRQSGNYYSPIASEAMLGILDTSMLNCISSDRLDTSLLNLTPLWYVDLDAIGLIKVGEVLSRITDNKSLYTAMHSSQIANRAYHMANYYGFEQSTCAKIYFAASLHDVGKLMVPIEVLNKPGKLTKEETCLVRGHAKWSYILLKDITGLEEVCKWAVSHHRKLNGNGYPDLPDSCLNMGFVSRMLACIDIYQGVYEARPYHKARTHNETMSIMWEMVNKGEIDPKITKDLEREMAKFTCSEGEAPRPIILEPELVMSVV